MKTELKRIYRIILIEILISVLLLYLVAGLNCTEVLAFIGGVVFFSALFRHLEFIIIKASDFKKELTVKNKKFLLTYFVRFLLIVMFFYATIKISKRIFLFAVLGFILGTVSLLIEAVILIFKGD